MADVTAIIAALGQQLAQALVDQTIAQVELAETQAALAAMREQPQPAGPGEGQDSQGPTA